MDSEMCAPYREVELRRLRGSNPPSEEPRWWNDIEVTVICAPGTAKAVLDRVKYVLGLVAENTNPDWPTLEQWRAMLPGWFVASFDPSPLAEPIEPSHQWWEKASMLPPSEFKDARRARLIEMARQWDLEGWLYWFKPANREWRWWDARLLDDGTTFMIELEAQDWLTPKDALIKLCLASGAEDVDYI